MGETKVDSEVPRACTPGGEDDRPAASLEIEAVRENGRWSPRLRIFVPLEPPLETVSEERIFTGQRTYESPEKARKASAEVARTVTACLG